MDGGKSALTQYDHLDANKELEQTIAGDLKLALEKRSFTVRHNGTSNSPAKSGAPDIEVWNESAHINVEVTKTTKSGADREMLSVADHLAISKHLHSENLPFALTLQFIIFFAGRPK